MQVKKIIKNGKFVDFEEYYKLKSEGDHLFDSLLPGDIVELGTCTYVMGCSNGGDNLPSSTVLWELDEDLNLIDSPNEWYERADHRPGDLENEDWIVHCRRSDEPGSVTARSYFPDDGYSIPPTCPIDGKLYYENPHPSAIRGKYLP